MFKKKFPSFIGDYLVVLVGVIAISFGSAWLINVAKLIDCDFKADYRCEVMHTIGVVLTPTFCSNSMVRD